MLQAIVTSQGGALTLIIDGEELPENAVKSERISVAEVALVRKVKPTALPSFVPAKAKGKPQA